MYAARDGLPKKLFYPIVVLGAWTAVVVVATPFVTHYFAVPGVPDAGDRAALTALRSLAGGAGEGFRRWRSTRRRRRGLEGRRTPLARQRQCRSSRARSDIGIMHTLGALSTFISFVLSCIIWLSVVVPRILILQRSSP